MRSRWSLIGVLLVGLALLSGTVGSSAAQQVVTITAWAAGSPVDGTRCSNLVEAAGQLRSETGLKIEPACQFTHVQDWAAYRQRFVIAYQAGQAPDIWTGGHEEIAWMAAAGYIVPVDEYIQKYWEQYELNDVFDSLWQACTWKGQLWCVPQDTEARPVYFRKDVLRQLGWSNAEIEALPERVRAGEFTLDDMIALAKQAKEAGLVEWGVFHRPTPGGYFHMMTMAFGGQLQDPETGKLVLDREAMLKNLQFHARLVQEGLTPPDMTATSWRSIHKAVVEGRVLFWFGGTWHWAEWQRVPYHGELGALSEDYLWENMGFMLVPAPERGGRPITQSHPFVYVITSQSQNPELAFRLAAIGAVRKDLAAKHAIEAGKLSIRKTNTAEYRNWGFGNAVSYMLEYTTTLPNHERFDVYHRAVYNAIQAVETGARTPEQALEDLVGELQRELGDDVIIR